MIMTHSGLTIARVCRDALGRFGTMAGLRPISCIFTRDDAPYHEMMSARPASFVQGFAMLPLGSWKKADIYTEARDSEIPQRGSNGITYKKGNSFTR